MSLTNQQLAVLKTDIQADPAATGTGTDAAPGQLVFEGTIDYRDVMAARNLP